MTRTRTLATRASSLAGGGALVLMMLVAPAGPAGAATVPLDLYAVTGTTSLPAGGQNVTVWGYSTTNTAVTSPGGPTLVVDQGDTVEITLHNQLAEPTALHFQGQAMIPDRTGAPPAGTKVYTFTADRAGTYLYEAGLLPNAEHQVAMGLYGALIVRPAAAGQAYDAPATAFDDEAVLVLSEIDPALNNAANPANFDMRKYAPRYFLVNGKVYPNTEAIPTAAGQKVLLRYVNAGNQYHSMAVLGAHQNVIALDGNPLAFAGRYVAETFGPGQTADVLVTAPTTTVDATLPVYDGSLLLHNSNLAGSGGMLTLLEVTGSGGGTDSAGPVTSDVAHVSGTLTATVDETTTGGADVQAAEYYVDSMAGPATPMNAADGAFDSPSEDVTLAVSVPSGNHILYVRGQDALGTWGVFSSMLTSGGDGTGPATTSPTLSPTPTNGSVAVALHATGDDTAAGGSAIAAAEYFIDVVGADGSGAPMIVNGSAPVASLDASILATAVNALTEGAHTIIIHAQDAAGLWGQTTSITLTVDKTGPTAGGLSVAPSPNNGTLGYTTATPSVRVIATTLSDALGTVRAAEAFLDTVGPNGTGIQFSASDGAFNSATEAGYASIPLSTVAQLTDGVHPVFVHARDGAGNWGAVVSVDLVVDKVRPVVGSVSVSPNPTQGAAAVTLSASGTDAGVGISRAEWFTGADPGVGNGAPMSITGTGPFTATSAPISVASWAEGTYTLTVRVRDGAGNWSVTATTVVTVTAPVYLSTFANTNPPGVGGVADDADIYSWNGTAYARQFDASVAGLPTAANIDGYDRVDDTHFYVSFSTATTTVPGLGTVQDEDVLYYDAGVWSVYFNGTAHGLTDANEDLDAISITGATGATGGTLYFSTLGNTNPPGVPGIADDADIYSWNGTTYTRVWDATVAGLPAATNTDGYVRIDATHFYLSLSPTTTTIPGLGATQDEDVLYNNNGTWSTYFNGTTHGLTNNNHDIDAFDIP